MITCILNQYVYSYFEVSQLLLHHLNIVFTEFNKVQHVSNYFVQKELVQFILFLEMNKSISHNGDAHL